MAVIGGVHSYRHADRRTGVGPRTSLASTRPGSSRTRRIRLPSMIRRSTSRPSGVSPATSPRTCEFYYPPIFLVDLRAVGAAAGLGRRGWCSRLDAGALRRGDAAHPGSALPAGGGADPRVPCAILECLVRSERIPERRIVRGGDAAGGPSPGASGFCFGALAFKPHFGSLVPWRCWPDEDGDVPRSRSCVALLVGLSARCSASTRGGVHLNLSRRTIGLCAWGHRLGYLMTAFGAVHVLGLARPGGGRHAGDCGGARPGSCSARGGPTSRFRCATPHCWRARSWRCRS